MAAVPGKDPDDTQSTAPVSPESRHEGSEPPSANTNSPQQHGTRPSASGPAEPLDHSVTLPNPSNQERNPTKELSPLRPQFTASARGTSRSRKNSQESSPTRNATTTFANPLPSAAAVQRALSANKLPLQASGVESPVESRNSSSTDSPARWPSTPRLTSPPPSKIPRNSTHPNRKQDQDMTAANSSQKRSSASVPDLNITAGKPIPEKEDSLAPRSSLKTPARGGSVVTPTLETVAENSVPDAPPALPPSERSSASSPQEDPDRQKGTLQDPPQHKSANHSGESDSDTGESQPCGESVEKPGNGEGSKSSSTLAKKSSLNPAPNKAKSSEGPIRSMTVETETVSSVPQAPLNVTVERASSAKLDANGPVRLKASNEMIRPKKEKKKNIRRPTSINTGTISSKADIFEAKVASAVDEANSSDSDETFVYESNPPEPYVPRSARHHSRTPSATSLASQVDQFGGRSKANGKEGQQSIAGKRSMKFANYNSNLDGEYGSQGGGGRGAGRTVTTPRHHHISRHSRAPSHAGLFDNESPFTQANRPASPRLPNGRSRPNSPRFGVGRITGTPRKSEAYSYDVDDGVADDERMPLIGSVRINRTRHSRRPTGGSLRMMDFAEDDERGWFARYGACFLVTFLFLILCVGGGSLITALSRPLVKVSIERIENVLATEQELMFDVNLRATNPNLFALTVSELNIDVFAKSGFAGTAAEWRAAQGRRSRRRRRARVANSAILKQRGETSPHADGVDEGNDPIEDPGSDPQTMVLGRIFEFDSPVVFDASPVRRHSILSLGEIRLTQPGNKTEEGGSARWERVIQHRFELIIGGVIKYQLPLSSRMRSAAVRSKIMVDPEDPEGARPADPPSGRPLLQSR